jgi:predicted nuclease with RNAse H fold
MNNVHRDLKTALQIRINAPLRDRLEDLRRTKRPIVPPLAELVRDLIMKGIDIDDPPKK